MARELKDVHRIFDELRAHMKHESYKDRKTADIVFAQLLFIGLELLEIYMTDTRRIADALEQIDISTRAGRPFQ